MNLNGVQVVGGSNPLAPTKKINGLADSHQSAFSFLEIGGALRGTFFRCHGSGPTRHMFPRHSGDSHFSA